MIDFFIGGKKMNKLKKTIICKIIILFLFACSIPYEGENSKNEEKELFESRKLNELNSGSLISMMEVGSKTITQTSSNLWHLVELQNTFTNPVVIMGPVSFKGHKPCTVRVKDVTFNEFKFQIDEWDYMDGIHITETVSYMVIEAGTYIIDDYCKIEAGIIKNAYTDWVSVPLTHSFTNAPIILTQCTSYNESKAVATRLTDITDSGFKVKLQTEESSNDFRYESEELCYVAIELNHPVSAQIWDTLSSDREIMGISYSGNEEWQSYNINNLESTPFIFGAIQTYIGSNPCTLRYKINNSSKNIFFRLQEEFSLDEEENHYKETIGMVIFTNGIYYSQVTVNRNWHQADIPWTSVYSRFNNWKQVDSSADGEELAAVNGKYIYTSRDGGDTWKQHTDNPGYGYWKLITSSDDGQTLYAAQRGDIYRSRDGGYTWAECIKDSSNDWELIKCSADGMRVLAYNYANYAYISTDGGESWNSDNVRRYWNVMDMSADGMKIVSGYLGNSFYISNDGGETWHWCNEAGGQLWKDVTISADGLVIAGVDYDALVISKDGGVTWNTYYDIIRDYSGYSIDCSSDGSILYIGGRRTIYKSIDYGLTWEDCRMNMGNKIVSISCSSDGNNIVGAQERGFIYTSENGGETWEKCINAGSRIFNEIAVSGDGQQIFTIDNLHSNTYRSTDKGTSWELLDASSPPCVSLTCSTDGSQLWAAINRRTYLEYSIDNGLSWSSNIKAGERLWTAVASSSQGDIVIASEYGGYIYRTEDHGESWSELTSAGLRNWQYIACSGNGEKLIAAPQTGYLYISIDNGQNWTEHREPGSKDWSGLAVSKDGTTFAASSFDGYICITEDNGNTWKEPFTRGHNWYDIIISSDGTKLAAADSGDYIYYSVDRGNNWNQQGNAGVQTWISLAGSDDFSTLTATAMNTNNGVFISWY
jgi:photosystem II stability/assembly factor-like uncharacterized protein